MPSTSCSVSTRSWSPTDDAAGQDRAVEHAARLAGTGGAPRPRPVGGRARELDLDAGRHGESRYRWLVAAPTAHAAGGARYGRPWPIYALGDQVPVDRRRRPTSTRMPW